MCCLKTARKFDTQCRIHTNLQVMNDGMLRKNFMITLETESTQLEARSNFLTCCVLAHTAGMSSLFSLRFSIVKIYIGLVSLEAQGSWLGWSLVFNNNNQAEAVCHHRHYNVLAPGWSKHKVSAIHQSSL